MRRCRFFILLSILFGAITTVVVAWTCAAAVDFDDDDFSYRGDNAWATWGAWSADRIVMWRSTRVDNHDAVLRIRAAAISVSLPWLGDRRRRLAANASHMPLPRWSRVRNWARDHSEPIELLRIEDARGWPFRSLRSVITVSYSNPPVFETWPPRLLLRKGPSPRDEIRNYRVLPVGPILPGLLLDTAFYGVIWFALFATRDLRRTLRRTRGKCPECGYDLRGNIDPDATPGSPGSPGCPECGWNRDA